MVTYTYKPGYTIEVTEQPTSFLVTLRGVEADAWGEKPWVDVVYTQGFAAEEDRDASVRETVRKFEMHEADEWLKRDGTPVRLCHGPGVDPDPG